MKGSKVVVVMGSRSDLPTMQEAVEALEDFGIKVHTTIVSAHRTPELLQKEVAKWEENSVEVIIAGAGGAAHLPGMLAAFSILPVIGVPIRSSAMNGLDALLSIAQMPRGVPVATVAVGNAFNAGLLAAQILGCHHEGLRKKVKKYKSDLNKKVSGDRKRLKKLGVAEFLKK